MDLRNFTGQNKTNKKELDMDKLGNIVKSYENKTNDELMEELLLAKKSGAITKEAVDSFFSAMSGVLPEETQNKMKKILDSLE